MANHKKRAGQCLLISIKADDRSVLFECYRDYLVFMSLVRDGVSSCQYKVYGFCWLKDQCLMLIEPENIGDCKFLLMLLKRYHFWLLQRGSSSTEFKLQILELTQSSWTLDSLRYLHQRAVKANVVTDAMDYHWHSHHIYNGFWSVNWLDTGFILDKFAGNRLVAMNRFRQYMLHNHRLDFSKMLVSDDCSNRYIGQLDNGSYNPNQKAVADVNSHYHRSLLERTRVTMVSRKAGQMIRVSVVEKTEKAEKNETNYSAA